MSSAASFFLFMWCMGFVLFGFVWAAEKLFKKLTKNKDDQE